MLEAFFCIILRLIPQHHLCLVDRGHGMGNVAGTLGTVNGGDAAYFLVKLRKILFKGFKKFIKRGVSSIGNIEYLGN